MMSSKVIVPPIKSQGIKTKLVPWITDLIDIAQPTGRWIEPFLGTGVVGFNAKFSDAILNDTNPHIIKFYRDIQSGIITPHTVKEFLQIEGKNLAQADNDGYVYYREVRDRFNREFAPLDFLFLSRSGFNGMMRFGSKKGNWNIPFCKKPNRFAQSYTTKIVNQVAAVQKVISPSWQFENKQFSEIIPLAKEGDIIYCDPPYYGRHVDYYNGWTEKDEELLFEQLSQTKAKFILSTWHHSEWRNNEMIDKFWSKFNIVTKDHFYHTGGSIENRKSVVEALVCNFNVEQIDTHNHNTKPRKQTKHEGQAVLEFD